jgi:hypothetical protein
VGAGLFLGLPFPTGISLVAFVRSSGLIDAPPIGGASLIDPELGADGLALSGAGCANAPDAARTKTTIANNCVISTHDAGVPTLGRSQKRWNFQDQRAAISPFVVRAAPTTRTLESFPKSEQCLQA